MNRKGFTLVEMIVSLAIFTVVAVVAVGALVRVVSANRQAQAIQSSVNTVSFTLESMTREMRVGTNYYCSPDLGIPTGGTNNNLTNTRSSCSLQSNLSGGLTIAFNSSNAKTYTSDLSKTCFLIYAYQFVPSAISGEYILNKAQQKDCETNISPTDFYPIISSSIHLTGYAVGIFKLRDTNYPWAFIRLAGYAGIKIKDQSRFDVQTSVTQRVVGGNNI